MAAWELGNRDGDEYRGDLQMATCVVSSAFHRELDVHDPPITAHSNLPSFTQDRVASPFPCLDCDRHFHRRNEWARHGCDVHQPELKLACPHIDCGSQFSRLYRLKRHYSGRHGGSSATITEGQLRYACVDKVWACGFCVNCSPTWKELAKHIWSHFESGSVKAHWSTSLYILSLLQHSSVRSDWLALLGERSDLSRFEWPDAESQELRAALEWICPSRAEGTVLAKMTYDSLRLQTIFDPSATLDSFSIHSQAGDFRYLPSDPTFVAPDVPVPQTALESAEQSSASFQYNPRATSSATASDNVDANSLAINPSGTNEIDANAMSQFDTIFLSTSYADWTPTLTEYNYLEQFDAEDESWSELDTSANEAQRSIDDVFDSGEMLTR